jgi:hypothetical protein
MRQHAGYSSSRPLDLGIGGKQLNVGLGSMPHGPRFSLRGAASQLVGQRLVARPPRSGGEAVHRSFGREIRLEARPLIERRRSEIEVCG